MMLRPIVIQCSCYFTWHDIIQWFRRYCLLVYIACFSTCPFFFSFPYLSFPLRIDPLHLRASSRKGRLNLALVFCVVVRFFWSASVRFCRVRFSFFPIPSLFGETSPKWPILCRVGCKTTTPSVSQSVNATEYSLRLSNCVGVRITVGVLDVCILCVWCCCYCSVCDAILALNSVVAWVATTLYGPVWGCGRRRTENNLL